MIGHGSDLILKNQLEKHSMSVKKFFFILKELRVGLPLLFMKKYTSIICKHLNVLSYSSFTLPGLAKMVVLKIFNFF
jgi:hypothetical protein